MNKQKNQRPYAWNHVFLLLFYALLILGFSTSGSYAFNEYNQLLAKHVKTTTKYGITSNMVNYSAWEKDPNYQIAKGKILNKKHSGLFGEHKKAYWINAYNFLTIDLIIRKKEKDSIKNLGNLFNNAWEKHKWQFYDRKYTLDEIEHEILRKMGDPRIHMAINCASLSCPNLRKEAYVAARLDEQLNQQTREFLSDSKKGLKFISKNKIIVSKIFDWFEEDFGGEEGVVRFINSFFPKVKDTATIDDYIEYNWKLNRI